MVPRIAHFYWTGGPLPWLRQQAIVTFMRTHPGWEVCLGSPEQRDDVPDGVHLLLDDFTNPALPPAARSDVWRYHALAEHGGVYADTDVIFLRSIEPLLVPSTLYEIDGYLTKDMGTPIHSYGFRLELVGGKRRRVARVGISIGVLASPKGSAFFGRAATLAARLGPQEDYQSHGTKLLTAHWQELTEGAEIQNIPARAFYRGSSPVNVLALWLGSGAFPKHEVGLHWYGGSPSSQPYLNARSIDELPASWVRAALERTAAGNVVSGYPSP